MKLPSTAQRKFSEVPKADIQRSAFDRVWGHKTAFDAGYLVPFIVDEALPGDTFNLEATLFTRLQTPIVPFMDNLYMDTFYFFVPMRLIWDNFQKFMGEQTDPGDSTDYEIPQMTAPAGGWTVGSLGDYMGLPPLVDIDHNTLPFRAYNLIYNEWFRDQNLQDSLVVDTDDGPDSESDYVLKRRCKRHDYFTSCLPWPQKGPGVEIPLGGEAPVLGIGKGTHTFTYGSTGGIYETFGTAGDTYAAASLTGTAGSDQFFIEEDPNNSGYPYIRADFSQITDGGTINSLRQAFQLQKMYERDARGGTRYTELVKSHFGVTSPDARLQRPEFLGGRSTPIMVTPVQQTSESGTTPQGNLAGYVTGTSQREGFVKSFTEHGYVLGLVSVRADLTYQQGLRKLWSRSTRSDFYFPALAHLGEQAVLNKEIYTTGTPATDDAVFGYQERWAEYKYYPSQITGKLRSQVVPNLDVWHLAQELSSPALNENFILESPPVDRVIAVADEPELVFDSYIKCRTVRPMPMYSVPGLVDHF